MINANGNSSVSLDNITFVNNNRCTLLQIKYNFLSTARKLLILDNLMRPAGSLISVLWGRFRLTDSIINNNKGQFKGAVVMTSDSDLTVWDCIFSNNTGWSYGAALTVDSNFQTNVQIVRSRFTENQVTNDGAALYIRSLKEPGIDIAMDSCVFVMNIAKTDSAIYLLGALASAHFSNVTIIGEGRKACIKIAMFPMNQYNYIEHIFLTHNIELHIGNISILSSSGKGMDQLLVSTGAVVFTDISMDNALNFALLEHHQSTYASGEFTSGVSLLTSQKIAF